MNRINYLEESFNKMQEIVGNIDINIDQEIYDYEPLFNLIYS